MVDANQQRINLAKMRRLMGANVAALGRIGITIPEDSSEQEILPFLDRVLIGLKTFIAQRDMARSDRARDRIRAGNWQDNPNDPDRQFSVHDAIGEPKLTPDYEIHHDEIGPDRAKAVVDRLAKTVPGVI